MPSPYKIEIFQPDFAYRDMSPIENPEIKFDYLTLEKTTIAAHNVAAVKGDFAHITDSLGSTVYSGIVDDVEPGDDDVTVTLTLKPLLALFDVSVYYDRSTLTTIEQFIAGMITATYISNADTEQNLTGLSVTATTTTAATLSLDSNIISLWLVITKAMTVYGVIVAAILLPQSKQILVTIGKSGMTATLEADLKNVLEKSIVIGDSYGQINKITYINAANETEKATYYLHTDGTVSTVDADRVTPVFFTSEIISGSNFAADALASAIDALTPQQYNNVIELTYRIDDALTHPDRLTLGAIATIYSGGQIMKSIYTGYIRDDKTMKLIFGVVRLELTKKLIMERRG